MECIELSLNGNPDFGRRSTVTITRNGDLITKVYLFVKLAALQLSQGSKAAWVRKLGHALLYSIEIDIGGSQIDKQYGVWLDIWYELARPSGKLERGFANMIGDVPVLTDYNSNSKPEYNLYVPLKFWFNRHVGLALPLIALQYHEVRLTFEFTNPQELVVANSHFKQYDSKGIAMKDVQLLVDYIYLDSEERRRFAQVGHEYLIEQLQFTGTESVQTQTGKYKLDYNHPSKELIWALRNGNYTQGQAFVYYTPYDWELHLNDAAQVILSESMVLLCAETTINGTTGEECTIVPCDNEVAPTSGDWEEFCPGFGGLTVNGNISVENNSQDKALWICTSSLKVGNYSLTDKIKANVLVTKNNQIQITNLSTTLTVRDLSIPVSEMEDTRAPSAVDDVSVYQFFNYGVLINGAGNPINYALIQLNGHDRFDRREGSYFNYVQPDQHHTNTPADGINVYSFALHPEQHQPSGSCNLSRIDNTQLNLWFYDPTAATGLPALNIFNSDNRLYIFDFSYNVLRIMSGMGGLAYSN